MSRWLWICPMLALVLTVLALNLWGWSWMTAGLIVLAWVCPALMVWGAMQARSPHDRGHKNSLWDRARK